MKYTLDSVSVAATENEGAKLAQMLIGRGGGFVALDGDLGAGKTAFVRGMASLLSPGSRVKSPTYTIVNEYLRGKIPFYHFDLYRVNDPDELWGIGFDDYLSGGICVAEWSSAVPAAVPDDAIRVTIEKTGDESRRITVEIPDDGETEKI